MTNYALDYNRGATRRPESLHRLLRRFDPAGARAIHPNDIPKLIRALEVYLLTRRPITSWFAEGRDALSGFQTLKIGLAPPRDLLYRRLDERCREMFETGLVEEVQGILQMGWPESSKPFESHGYRQALAMLRGEMTRDQAVDGCADEYQALRQAADDLVPQGTRRRMVDRFRR